MPVTPAVGDVLEMKIYNKLNDQVAVNVVHFKVSSLGGAGINDNLIALGFGAGVAPLYKAWMPATALHLGVRVQIISPGVVPVHQRSTIDAGVGARAADGLAPQLCLLTAKKSALAKPRNRGRIYYPFFAEDQNAANGTPSAGAITLADAASAYLFTNKTFTVGADSVTCVPVLWQRAGLTAVNIESFAARDRWATQRRRSSINPSDSFGP